MNEQNAYKAAMAQVRFDGMFEERALRKLGEIQRRRKKRLICLGAAAVCTMTAVALIMLTVGKPQIEQRIAEASAPASPAATITSAPTSAATPDLRTVLVSSEYSGSLTDSYMSPGQGQTGLTDGVRLALEEPANADACFFVQIDILSPEQYASRFDDYVYNGRTVAEWHELIDLANGTYPYSEYNGDHGGNITKEQWQAAQEEAKTLDAQANCDAAVAQYRAGIEPMLAEAKAQREQSECARLQALGYDVFFMDTWAYTGAAEKEYYRIFAGLLSAEQLTGFAADAQCGYFIDWVHCGDGVLDWSEGLRPQE